MNKWDAENICIKGNKHSQLQRQINPRDVHVRRPGPQRDIPEHNYVHTSEAIETALTLIWVSCCSCCLNSFIPTHYTIPFQYPSTTWATATHPPTTTRMPCTSPFTQAGIRFPNMPVPKPLLALPHMWVGRGNSCWCGIHLIEQITEYHLACIEMYWFRLVQVSEDYGLRVKIKSHV